MAIELFLMPMAFDPDPLVGWHLKYLRTFGTFTSTACLAAAGPEMAVVCLDGDQAILDQVAAQADVLRLATAATIDATLTAGQATAVKAVLESLDLPAAFANTGDTRRTVIRKILGMYVFSSRMEERFGMGWRTRAQSHGITLDSTWTSFPQALKDVFLAMRDDFVARGLWPVDGITLTGSSTLRQIMGVIAQQWGVKPFHVGRLTL